jgi:deoxyadenosine/deoxycytidine kinase
MLRIITEHRGGAYRLELHGSITGDWIAVLERHWRDILEAAPSAVVIVGLSNVVFIDADGERLLRRMAQRGVAFEGAGCMNRYVIEKVSGGM